MGGFTLHFNPGKFFSPAESDQMQLPKENVWLLSGAV